MEKNVTATKTSSTTKSNTSPGSKPGGQESATGLEKSATGEWKEPQSLELVLAPKDLPVSLGKGEAEELKKCEAIIEKARTAALDGGRALMAIRDKRLYRDHYATFEDYCRERWGSSRTHVNRSIRAAEVNAALAPIGAKLEKESQLRPLAGLKTEEIQAAYTKAKEAVGDKEITAKVMGEAAAQYRPKKPLKKKGRKKAVPKAINVKSLLKQIGRASCRERV